MADKITKKFIKEHIESVNRNYGTDFKLDSVLKRVVYDDGQNWYVGDSYRDLHNFLCRV